MKYLITILILAGCVTAPEDSTDQEDYKSITDKIVCQDTTYFYTLNNGDKFLNSIHHSMENCEGYAGQIEEQRPDLSLTCLEKLTIVEKECNN